MTSTTTATTTTTTTSTCTSTTTPTASSSSTSSSFLSRPTTALLSARCASTGSHIIGSNSSSSSSNRRSSIRNSISLRRPSLLRAASTSTLTSAVNIGVVGGCGGGGGGGGVGPLWHGKLDEWRTGKQLSDGASASFLSATAAEAERATTTTTKATTKATTTATTTTATTTTTTTTTATTIITEGETEAATMMTTTTTTAETSTAKSPNQQQNFTCYNNRTRRISTTTTIPSQSRAASLAGQQRHRSNTFLACLIEDLQWAFQELYLQQQQQQQQSSSSSSSLYQHDYRNNNNNNNNNIYDLLKDDDDDDDDDDDEEEEFAELQAATRPIRRYSRLQQQQQQQQQQQRYNNNENTTSTLVLPLDTLEEWAVFLYTTHSDNPRGFHSISHIFETTAAATPIQLLSACFRDSILIMANHHHNHDDHDHDDDESDNNNIEDETLEEFLQRSELENIFEDTNIMAHHHHHAPHHHCTNGGENANSNSKSRSSKYILNATTLEQEPDVRLVASIFGFHPGQDLQPYCGRHQGLDAFLSAVCAARLLRPFLSMTHLAQMAVCLEAHIPFRNIIMTTTETTGTTSTSTTTSKTTTSNTTNNNNNNNNNNTSYNHDHNIIDMPNQLDAYHSMSSLTRSVTQDYSHKKVMNNHSHTKHEDGGGSIALPDFSSPEDKKMMMNHALTRSVTQVYTPPEDPSSFTSSPVMERLYQRLVQVNQDFQLHLSEQDMVRSIQQAADFANRGLGNLASSDPQVFLQHMWSLLPEHYEPLRRQFLYTVVDLHTAVQDMRHFFHTLRMSHFSRQGRYCGCCYAVFHSFRGIPNAMEMKHFHQQVQYNVTIGYEYLLAQCVSLRIVAALANVTTTTTTGGGSGGGAGSVPMSFFFGDQPHRQPRSDDEPKMVRLGEALFDMEFGPKQPQQEQQQQQQQYEKEDLTKDDHDTHGYPHHHDTFVTNGGYAKDRIPHDSVTGDIINEDVPAKTTTTTTDGTSTNHHNHHREQQQQQHSAHRELDSIRAVVLRILQEDCWGAAAATSTTTATPLSTPEQQQQQQQQQPVQPQHVYNFLDPRNAYLAAYLYKQLNHSQMELIANHPLDGHDDDDDDDDDEDDDEDYNVNESRYKSDMLLLRQYVPLDVLELIAEDLGQIAITRACRLEALLQNLRATATTTTATSTTTATTTTTAREDLL